MDEGRGRWCEPVVVSRRRVKPGNHLSDLSDNARLGQPRTSTVRPSNLQHRQQSTATMASSDRQATGQHPAPIHAHCSATDAHLPLAADATVLILCPSLPQPTFSPRTLDTPASDAMPSAVPFQTREAPLACFPQLTGAHLSACELPCSPSDPLTKRRSV